MDAIKRFVVYAPHSEIWFFQTVRNFARGKRTKGKYAWLLDSLYANNDKVYFSRSFEKAGGLRGFIKYLIDPLELIIWCIIHGLPLRKTRYVIFAKQLKRMDCLIAFYYGSIIHVDSRKSKRLKRVVKIFSEFQGKKIFHMTHYAYRMADGAQRLSLIKPHLLLAENDLSKNARLFSEVFGHINCNFGVLPFVAGERFLNANIVKTRKRKVLCTGTLTYPMEEKLFIDICGTDEYQPLRRQIYSNRDSYAYLIESMISDISAVTPSGENSNKGCDLVTQDKYYSQDIVMAYSSFLAFAVPEEACGLPGIGFVEGMCCGSLYIGKEDPMYTDLGMVSGIHYVAYDGSFADFIRKSDEVISNPIRAERIAFQGKMFARCNFSRSKVSVFFEQLLNELWK